MDKRKSFVVYTDLLESLASFTAEEVGDIFTAMLIYAAEGRETDLTDREAVAFGFIRAQMDRDADKYDEIIEKRRAAGRARQEQANATKSEQVLPNATKCYQMPARATDNDTVNVTDTENVNENENVTDSIIPPKPPEGAKAQKRFIAPTVEEVAEYCRERKNGVDAQRFIDYYASNGWKVGRNAMKDWKAAVRTWERNGYGSGAPAQERKEAAPATVNKYAPPAGTTAAGSFNRMLDRARQCATEREAAK